MYLACYSAKELCHNPNPIALGSRWLAYADKKVGSTLSALSQYSSLSVFYIIFSLTFQSMHFLVLFSFVFLTGYKKNMPY